MDVEDYYPQGKRWWFRLHEKGGKHHEMPAHHKAEEYVDAYIEAAGLEDQKKGPLFRSAIGKTKQLSDRRMSRHAALKMVQRRAKKAGILTADLLPQLPGDRDHELPGERRDAGEGPADGRPRVGEDDQALRPARRRDDARRGRADRDLT